MVDSASEKHSVRIDGRRRWPVPQAHAADRAAWSSWDASVQRPRHDHAEPGREILAEAAPCSSPERFCLVRGRRLDAARLEACRPEEPERFHLARRFVRRRCRFNRLSRKLRPGVGVGPVARVAGEGTSDEPPPPRVETLPVERGHAQGEGRDGARLLAGKTRPPPAFLNGEGGLENLISGNGSLFSFGPALGSFLISCDLPVAEYAKFIKSAPPLLHTLLRNRPHGHEVLPLPLRPPAS
jgi:hypothetical protein